MRTIHQPKYVKARKSHVCNVCSKEIDCGEGHSVATYEDNSMIFNWRMCSRCVPWVNEAIHNPNYNFEDGMSEQDFRNYMYEEHPDIARRWWE